MGKQNVKTSVEASVIRAFWCVFGYSFVGIISLVYGVTLQIYNYGVELITDLFVSDNSLKLIYTTLMFIIVFYNLLFCHAYASLYIKESDIDKHLYPKLGHWMETILLVFILTYFVPLVFSYSNLHYILLTMLLISVPWFFCIVFYRTYLSFGNIRTAGRHERLKYRLIIPTTLLIATNIYVGSCIVEMLNGDWEYYIPFILIILFVVIYCLIDYFDYKKKKVKANCLEKLLPYFYAGTVSVGATIILYWTHYFDGKAFEISSRTLFLANFVAIYLAMFEGWFLLGKGMSVVEGTKSNINEKVKSGVKIILKWMPLVVFGLFPIQRFQLLYVIFFSIGHICAWLYWTYYEFNDGKKIRSLPFMRGLFGTVTLLGLILDKWYPMDIDVYIGRVFGTRPMDAMISGLVVVNVVISVVAIVTQHIKFSGEKIEPKQIITNRTVWYIIVIIILCVLYMGVQDISQVRIFVSMVGCLVFIVVELVLGHFENQETESETSNESPS